MLAGEEARAALESLADPNWQGDLDKRVAKLPRGLRSTARQVVSLPNGQEAGGWQAWYAEQARAGDALDKLKPAQLAKIMGALHPTLGPALAHWWVSAQRQPYDDSWSRRGFRAPHHPEISRAKRIRALSSMIHGTGPYSYPPEWFAAWAPFVNGADSSYGRAAYRLGPLLASAIDLGGPSGDATFQTLIASGNNDHPVGGMGHHVIVGLLRCGRPEGWEFIEATLLAAQRQEGLRQSILEAADEAHPEAFTRMIDLAIRENLIRFAATIRAVGVWLGFSEQAEYLDDARTRLETLQVYRADHIHARRQVVEGGPWDTYLGLVALGHTDVFDALEVARLALRSADRDNRAAALRFIANTQLPLATTIPIYVEIMGDTDLAIAARAHKALARYGISDSNEDLYPSLEGLARRLPESPTTSKPVGIDPEPVALNRGDVVTTMLQVVDGRPLEPLLDFLPSMDPDARSRLVKAASARTTLDGDLRATVVKLLGDKSTYVRQAAVEAIGDLSPTRDEAMELEALLKRKAADLRRGVIELLSRLPGDDAVAAAERLWGGTASQRDAACELLDVIERTDVVVATAEAFLAGGASKSQATVLDAIVSGVGEDIDDPTLGLYHEADMTPPRTPVKAPKAHKFVDQAALNIVERLDDLVAQHRDTPLEMVNWQRSVEVLLGDARILPEAFRAAPAQSEPGQWGMVLPEVFATWWEQRPDDCRGEADSLDAFRALVALSVCRETDPAHPRLSARGEISDLVRKLAGGHRLAPSYPTVVRHVLLWVLKGRADLATATEGLRGANAVLASVPDDWIQRLPTIDSTSMQDRARDWRVELWRHAPWMPLTNQLFAHDPLLFSPEMLQEWYGLMCWFSRPIKGAPRRSINPALLFAAHAIDAATDADVIDDLIAHRRLREFTKHRRDHVVERYPTVVPLADRLRDRVVELERTRGELSTAASPLVFALSSIAGADVALELLARLGRSTLVRGYVWKNAGRDAVYSRLLQISHPAPDDTAATVAALIEQHSINDGRLVDLAMFAPQWAPLIEAGLGWDGLEDAIWWFHAHTKDKRWAVEAEVRETWASMSAERTPLSAQDLTDGAVDVDWFRQAHKRLGTDRWALLHKAAKLASGGAGHRRAQIFADAMRGELDEDALVTRIKTKRHQDSVRALGLLPIPKKGAAVTALRRYQLLREFERGSKKFGSQRQQSERIAVRIGIENLARTTGASDPQRFTWAMEADEAGELADGPISVTKDDLTVTLSIDSEGAADVAVMRGDKPLKAVPAKLRKHPPIKELTERRTALKRQASRVRAALEAAMVRQDLFASADFKTLRRHPLLAPMLELLVWVDAEGITLRRRGASWFDVTGTKAKPKGKLRIAHPVDLLGTGNWIDWQERLFVDAERQPFKQAFRELYVLTDAEARDSPVSRRWSGHQLQSRQAAALFGSRGWVSDYDSGEVAKVYHHAGLVARVRFVDGWGTPAEVELPTIDSVMFTKRGEYLAQPLDSIPAVLFSEAMRDLDLVVSVAHAGGVDPEASASTIEMRAALVRETARLMQLDNVRRESNHIVIEGSLGEYSLHLGSGSVHRRPGGSLCIIAIDAQRRGRVFLPFADDDPRSAEVVSKVLLLARDAEIKDPTILEQLRR